jgi:hypothetical protein
MGNICAENVNENSTLVTCIIFFIRMDLLLEFT